ncbi:hypothetical protein CIHG_10518 [Coccidioides immitis H538.4]|uniref:Uncharacterized protein n=1 Tax=Coccidioides immitis H538.4 TaxID=396776 RepID=A0A0J8S8N1_COCIT|nr:hypothetical protein CIHG_10518 [Coccidioides immitis H538.4]
MSLQEIETLISEKGIQLQLLQKEMMKQITFGDQFEQKPTSRMAAIFYYHSIWQF